MEVTPDLRSLIIADYFYGQIAFIVRNKWKYKHEHYQYYLQLIISIKLLTDYFLQMIITYKVTVENILKFINKHKEKNKLQNFI